MTLEIPGQKKKILQCYLDLDVKQSGQANNFWDYIKKTRRPNKDHDHDHGHDVDVDHHHDLYLTHDNNHYHDCDKDDDHDNDNDVDGAVDEDLDHDEDHHEEDVNNPEDDEDPDDDSQCHCQQWRYGVYSITTTTLRQYHIWLIFAPSKPVAHIFKKYEPDRHAENPNVPPNIVFWKCLLWHCFLIFKAEN